MGEKVSDNQLKIFLQRIISFTDAAGDVFLVDEFS